MQEVRRKSYQARRRLVVERFLALLPAQLSALLVLASTAVMLPKWMVLPVPAVIWYCSWLGGAVVVGLLVSFIMTWLSRPTLSVAAAEVDRRFQLRERLSSSLTLTPEDQQTDLGQALMVDAERRAEVLDIASQFTWGAHRKLLLPLLPLLLSSLYFVLPDRQSQASPELNQVEATLIKSSTQPLLDQIRKKRQEAEEQDLLDAAEMLKKLEGELERMAKNAKLDPQEALTKLNDIKQQLNERKQELGNSESLKKSLQNLDKFDAGPLEKLADSLKSGDMEKAQKAVQDLLEDLKSGKMSSEQLEKLKNDMERLNQSIQQAAQAHEEAKQKLEDQIRKAKQSGDQQRAGELQRKLEQMQANDNSISRMQEMAQQLGKCQQCLSKGDQEGMQEALQDISEVLQELSEGDQQLQDLDQLLNELSECKSGMCKGKGDQPGKGQGLGEGKGQGDRPEEDSDVDFFQSQVRGQLQPGENVFSGKVGGQNRKGLSQVEVQQEITRELTEEPEPLDETPLPRNQREHTRDYFNSIREGQ
jgi:hypothetical protein